ncbi:MAG: hypothetical protein J5546_02385, partial [Lachnospiraceae bacterium]|nr:hypothetical protein [Lachnospiraceae bacterium]
MFVQVFYGTMFVASILLAATYIHIWHKHFDVNFTMVFSLVPIANLGYWMGSTATNLRESFAALKVIYIGGCFLQLFILFSIMNLCRVKAGRWIRILLFISVSLIYASVLTIGQTDLFYKSVTLEMVDGLPMLTKQYAWMHTVFYVVLFLLFLASLVVIGYSWLKKSQVPRTIIYLLVLPDIICVFSFFFGRMLIKQLDLVPLGYVIAEVIYLLIAYRVNLYDVGETVIDSMVRERSIGYISFDFKNRYLGSNEMARHLIPELTVLAVDQVLGETPNEKKIWHFLESFQKNQDNNLFAFTFREGDSGPDDEQIYNVNVNYLYDGAKKRGYIITFTDDTQNRKYIQLLDTYNDKLRHEVDAKTQHIMEMHDNLIMSLATMVESRDNSTGGHIRRTSEGVRILVDEILKKGTLSLSEEFCKDVIKAAPMHDLGKIAVDDEVLRKPGKFTQEEFEKMKIH